MSDTFYIKKGDTSPAIQATLKDSDGNAVNLTGASVNFHMYTQDRVTVVVDSSATLVTPSSGIVKYEWDSDDTDTAGVFVAEFEVTFSDSSVETFPNKGYITILISKELA